MHKSMFLLADLMSIAIEGWTDGTTWNGWATPHFELDAAMQLVFQFRQIQEEAEEKAWYDSASDQFCFIIEGDTEPECYPAEFIEADHRRIKVYPIGTSAWIWEETKAAA